MTLRPCKAAADCQGDILEMAHTIPLLIATGEIPDTDHLDELIEIKEEFAKKYRKWKKKALPV